MTGTNRTPEAISQNRKENDARAHRCCFTGHYPQELHRLVDDIKVDLENEILASIQSGYTTFITGMAYGVDIWAGNIVIRLKDRFPELKLIAAVPFPGFSELWDGEWKEKYDRLLSAADLRKVLSPRYSPAVCRARNEWMIEQTSKVIAVYNGRKGETREMIQYARKKQVFVRYLKG